jgi:hypothetical protein
MQAPSLNSPEIMPYAMARSVISATSQQDRDRAASLGIGEDASDEQLAYLYAVKSLSTFYQYGANAFHFALSRLGYPPHDYQV